MMLMIRPLGRGKRRMFLTNLLFRRRTWLFRRRGGMTSYAPCG